MQEILVIGSGITGLAAALDLARLSYPVRLIEREAGAGGHAVNYACKATETCQQCGACLVSETLQKVLEEPLITISMSTEVKDLEHDEQGVVATLASPSGEEEQTLFPAVLLCTGFMPFDPHQKPHFGYGRIPNMITGFDLEAVLRHEGGVQRPTTGQPPESVAFVQCVGSRDPVSEGAYCSRVCCAYALRLARVMKSQYPDMKITFFYMDIQTFGKNFARLWPEVKNELRMVREMPGEYYAAPGDRIGVIVPSDKGPREEVFDMIVLSIGMRPHPDYAKWAERLGLTLNRDGFLHEEKRKGVFLAGSATGPRDIKECMADAHAAVHRLVQSLQEGV
jgi:heterodisulfide reductase subunit A